jgi:hypothetical protein
MKVLHVCGNTATVGTQKEVCSTSRRSKHPLCDMSTNKYINASDPVVFQKNADIETLFIFLKQRGTVRYRYFRKKLLCRHMTK